MDKILKLMDYILISSFKPTLMSHKQEGFNNQISFILPESTQHQLQLGYLTNLLYITDVGYYPMAKYHFRERENGCDQHILLFCTQGKGWIKWQNNQRVITKDTFVIIPAGIAHSYGADDNAPWSIYWAHFKGSKSGLLAGNGIMVESTSTDENSRNDRRVRLFDEIFQNLSMGYSRENLDYASICLWYLLGSFAYAPQFERIRSVHNTDIVEKSIVYMAENIHNDLTLSQMAAHCQLSVSHFSKLFKTKINRSPVDYYIELKIQKACQLLDHTHLKMADVANQIGIADPFYFSRLFSKVMGMSPSSYRGMKKG
jgi:AraC family transcriptional regulator of arabinose operon